MIRAYLQAIAQLSDPGTRRVVWIGGLSAALALAVLWGGIAFVIARTELFQWGWAEWAADVLGWSAALILALLLFPAVASATIGLFLEDAAAAVECRHYPGLPAPRNVGAAESLGTSLRFLAVTVGTNLVVLLFLVVPPVFPFVFYGINGYLLGREYFEMVAQRRVSGEALRAIRQTRGTAIFVAGLAAAFLLTIPVVNLVAPVIATAAMVHLFEGWRRQP
ncbi:MAG: hypothetical protein FJX51_09415 [Alphaproteobacteria bacterium]|nr:hypothetical protein [Alphaproteobacteria bacterium]